MYVLHTDDIAPKLCVRIVCFLSTIVAFNTRENGDGTKVSGERRVWENRELGTASKATLTGSIQFGCNHNNCKDSFLCNFY